MPSPEQIEQRFRNKDIAGKKTRDQRQLIAGPRGKIDQDGPGNCALPQDTQYTRKALPGQRQVSYALELANPCR